MADRMLADDAARHAATTDLDHNLVVVAGAGTGKTSLLVERVLVAVGSGSMRLVDIGAITFTEKAAGEMRVRIATGLEELRAGASAENDPPQASEARRALATLRSRDIEPTEIARHALEALVDLDHAVVDTIHGFCSALLRSHPVQAAVDPRFAIDGGERAQSTRRETWDAFLGRELGPVAERTALWNEVLGRMTLTDVRNIAFAFGDFGVPLELLDGSHGPADSRELLGPTAAVIVSDLDDLLARARGLTPTPERYLVGLRDALRTFVDDGLDALRAFLDREPELAQRLDDRPTVPAKNRLSGVDRNEVNDRMSSATRLVRMLDRVDDALAARIFELVAPFARRAREEMLRRGFVTFDGLLALARDLLRDHSDVRRAVRARFRMLLVDELQDTDPRQYEIILLLGAGDDADTHDPLSVTPEPGRLFLVGDPKQSIYRFRGADFGSYRIATDRVVEQGGRELTLQANFRSVPGILAPVNRLFGGPAWFPKGTDARHQPTYVPIEAARATQATDPSVELWTVRTADGDDVESPTRRDTEGAVLAAEIARIVALGAVPYRKITILFRALTTVSHYLRPLRQLGVPFVVDGGREFLNRPEVTHLLCALRTLAYPTDETALLGFLRSPAGGVSDLELAEFAEGRGRWDFRVPVDASAFPKIAARFAGLCRLAREVKDVPADVMVRRVLDDTLLLPLGAAGFEGAQRVVNLRKLATAVADLARDGTLSFGEILAAVEEGKLLDLVSDAPLVDDSVDAVRVTSIHKMKGLENDWVFVPDLLRSHPREDRGSLLHRAIRTPRGQETLALRVGDVHNTAAVLWQIEHERHEAAEEIRVLYVAATRARERLVLLAGARPKRASSPWVDTLAAWGYDAESPPAHDTLLCDGLVRHRVLEPAAVVVPDRDPEAEAGAEDARARYDHAIERLRAAAPPFVTPSALAEVDRALPASGASGSAGNGRIVGIAVHRFLERHGGSSRAEGMGYLDALCRRTALEEGADPRAVRSEAQAILESFYASVLGTRLARLDVLGREVPVLAAHGNGTALRGTIDVIARDENGTIVVIDYKTDRETDPAELCRIHGPQLLAYVEAVQDALGLAVPPRAEIWALRAGVAVPVVASGSRPG
jgi:ATP-dependent helicase/nuclease subunit A